MQQRHAKTFQMQKQTTVLVHLHREGGNNYFYNKIKPHLSFLHFALKEKNYPILHPHIGVVWSLHHALL